MALCHLLTKDADEIAKVFNISKKNFKSSLTLLISATNKISLNETGILLIK